MLRAIVQPVRAMASGLPCPREGTQPGPNGPERSHALRPLEYTKGMRWVFGLVALLIAMLVVLSLQARSAKRTMARATHPIPSLQEQVAPIPFDAAAASRLANRLEELAGTSALPVAELEAATATAAGWAKATSPGSGPYRAAVRLRSAANALLNATGALDDPRRGEARRLLAEARQALASRAPLPGGPAAGIQDQLDNLQRSLEEQRRQVESDGP